MTMADERGALEVDDDPDMVSVALKLAAYLAVCPPSRWRMLNINGQDVIGKEAGIEPEDVFSAYCWLIATGIFSEPYESRVRDGIHLFINQWSGDGVSGGDRLPTRPPQSSFFNNRTSR